MSKTVTINATGGTGNYQYSIDGSTYQSSNTFEEVAAGDYYGYVKDENNCEASGSFNITSPSVTYPATSTCQPTATQLEGFLYDASHFALEIRGIFAEESAGAFHVQRECIRLFYYGSDWTSATTVSLTPSYTENASRWSSASLDANVSQISSTLVSTTNLVGIQWFLAASVSQGHGGAGYGEALANSLGQLELTILHKLSKTTEYSSTFNGASAYRASTSAIIPYILPTYCEGASYKYLYASDGTITDNGAITAHADALTSATSANFGTNPSRSVGIYPIKKTN